MCPPPPHFSSSFGAAQAQRLCERGLSALFERAKGAPGLIGPMCRAIFARAHADTGNIDPDQVEDTLERWDLA